MGLLSKNSISIKFRPTIQSLKFEKASFCYPASVTGPGAEILVESNFDFPMNQFVWIRASEGGLGRSTLLQLLAGLRNLNEGKYLINQQNVSEMSFEEFLPFRMSIGYGFDLNGLIHNRTLLENLILPLMYHKIMTLELAEQKAIELMDLMEITKYKNQRPSSVPGGVRKITCILRPLLMKPQLLLLDDPSMGVSHSLMVRYMDCILDLKKDGFCQHVFISTMDEQLMTLVDHQEISIDQKKIHNSVQGKIMVCEEVLPRFQKVLQL